MQVLHFIQFIKGFIIQGGQEQSGSWTGINGTLLKGRWDK